MERGNARKERRDRVVRPSNRVPTFLDSDVAEVLNARNVTQFLFYQMMYRKLFCTPLRVKGYNN